MHIVVYGGFPYMAHEHHNRRTDREPEELNDPKNPPQSVLKPEVRRAALMSYLGPVVALFAVVGIVLIYWSNRGPVSSDVQRQRDAVGTIGSSPGGTDRTPRFRTTDDELRYRGADKSGRAETGRVDPTAEPKLDSVRSIEAAGRRVEIDNAEVVSMDGSVMWIIDGDTRIAVLVPEGGKPMKSGARVRVTGTTEIDPQGNLRIRASGIETK
jgi:hypothetical protein